MVIEAEAVVKAVEKALKFTSSGLSSRLPLTKGKQKNTDVVIIWLSPSGKQFTNEVAEKYAKKVEHLIIICGRYEGIDERVRKIFKTESISIGPYVLTGGELPAMVILDTISRRLPGVLGKIESVEENRTASSAVYTRPEILTYRGKKYRVPKVLLSGHHAHIEDWKRKRK